MMHIQRFIERLQGFDARAAKDFTMPLRDAKDLHADITQLLIELKKLQEMVVNAQQDDVVVVKMDGGKF
jgi:hypothetical protein